MLESARILIVGVDWLGDIVFSTAFIRLIRRRFPGAFIAVSLPREYFPLLEDNPHINELIGFRERLFVPGLVEHARFFIKIRKRRFDRVYHLHRSGTRIFLTWLAGIPERRGLPDSKQARLLSVPPANNSKTQLHRSEFYSSVAGELSAEEGGVACEVFIEPSKFEAARTALVRRFPALKNRYAVIHPGGNWNLKRWPLKRFEALAVRLSGQGFSVAVCGSGSERALANEILRHKPSGVFSVCGQTTLRELAALLKGAALVVSNDSGPLHLANALGTPCVGIYGPTEAAHTGPRGSGPRLIAQNRIGCSLPCYFKTCHDQFCMQSLTVEAVWTHIQSALAGSAPVETS